MPLRVYDETIRVLRGAIDRAKLGSSDRLHAIQKLDAESRALEAVAHGPSFDEFVSVERSRSGSYGGRTVLQ